MDAIILKIGAVITRLSTNEEFKAKGPLPGTYAFRGPEHTSFRYLGETYRCRTEDINWVIENGTPSVYTYKRYPTDTTWVCEMRLKVGTKPLRQEGFPTKEAAEHWGKEVGAAQAGLSDLIELEPSGNTSKGGTMAQRPAQAATGRSKPLALAGSKEERVQTLLELKKVATPAEARKIRQELRSLGHFISRERGS